jgi:hypothetical protein
LWSFLNNPGTSYLDRLAAASKDSALVTPEHLVEFWTAERVNSSNAKRLPSDHISRNCLLSSMRPGIAGCFPDVSPSDVEEIPAFPESNPIQIHLAAFMS